MSIWKKIIIEALTELGGISHYSDLYDTIRQNRRDDLPKSWQAIVRRTIENNSSDSEAFTGNDDIFYSVEGIGFGVWGIRNYVPTKETVHLTEDDLSFSEGRVSLRKHVFRERNPKVIHEAKKRFKSKHGKLYCEACGFDFRKIYGKIGFDFIEGHHVKPISEMKAGERTQVEDIVLVCSNCHKMLHRKRPWLTKSELQFLIQNNN